MKRRTEERSVELLYISTPILSNNHTFFYYFTYTSTIEMVASAQLALFFFVSLLFIGSTLSIKCYSVYGKQANKTPSSNREGGSSEPVGQSSHSKTPEKESCSAVGCACFSYKTACSPLSSTTTRYSPCNDQDEENKTIKWKWGWTSNSTCEQMRQQPEIYLNLICCHTDLCNNQSETNMSFRSCFFSSWMIFLALVLHRVVLE
jgi:hypothetical protein